MFTMKYRPTINDNVLVRPVEGTDRIGLWVWGSSDQGLRVELTVEQAQKIVAQLAVALANDVPAEPVLSVVEVGTEPVAIVKPRRPRTRKAPVTEASA